MGRRSSSPSRAPPSRPMSTRSSPPPRTTPPPPKSSPPPPAPQQQQRAPPPQQQSTGGGGILSGIGSTIMQGMAFGTGSAIAHRAVGAVAGGLSGNNDNQQQQQQPQQQQPVVPFSCQDDYKAFTQCMNDNPNNIQACDFYMQSLQQCQAANQ
eukprot:TRINITY_DN65849_c8_g9_i1.p1 TRINITY_DN65849_c8_g9~~TRINITY_DN65849_c8_g9_i1.p1  ORF type:complete len:153 (-),score=38.68 TRINITY_DN65849_c8_g9_i1:87-545(-)